MSTSASVPGRFCLDRPRQAQEQHRRGAVGALAGASVTSGGEDTPPGAPPAATTASSRSGSRARREPELVAPARRRTRAKRLVVAAHAATREPRRARRAAASADQRGLLDDEAHDGLASPSSTRSDRRRLRMRTIGMSARISTSGASRSRSRPAGSSAASSRPAAVPAPRPPGRASSSPSGPSSWTGADRPRAGGRRRCRSTSARPSGRRARLEPEVRRQRRLRRGQADAVGQEEVDAGHDREVSPIQPPRRGQTRRLCSFGDEPRRDRGSRGTQGGTSGGTRPPRPRPSGTAAASSMSPDARRCGSRRRPRPAARRRRPTRRPCRG